MEKSFCNNDENLFLKRIKFKEDPDKAILLKIQETLEQEGITAENVYNLTRQLI